MAACLVFFLSKSRWEAQWAVDSPQTRMCVICSVFCVWNFHSTGLAVVYLDSHIPTQTGAQWIRMHAARQYARYLVLIFHFNSISIKSFMHWIFLLHFCLHYNYEKIILANFFFPQFIDIGQQNEINHFE